MVLIKTEASYTDICESWTHGAQILDLPDSIQDAIDEYFEEGFGFASEVLDFTSGRSRTYHLNPDNFYINILEQKPMLEVQEDLLEFEKIEEADLVLSEASSISELTEFCERHYEAIQELYEEEKGNTILGLEEGVLYLV